MVLRRLAGFVLLIAAMPAAAVTYTITPIVLPGGAPFNGGGLGADGTIVGQRGDTLRPVVRRPDGSIEDLPTLGGNRGSGSAINAVGTIVGGSRTGTTGASSQPFIRPAGGSVAAIPLPTGASFGSAAAINDAGTVTGSFRDTGGATRGFVWSSGAGTSLLDLPAGFGNSDVAGINASGLITGNAFTSTGDISAVRWSAAAAATLLPGIGGGESQTGGINDAGTIVGVTYFGIAPQILTRATVWSLGGAPQDAGLLAGDTTSSLSDINNLGVAVGISGIVDNFCLCTSRLVFWTASGGMVAADVDFGTSGLRIVGASAINDAGQILATAIDANFVTSRVLLNPVAAMVPEPASWALMIGGFGLVGSTLRRRRRELLAIVSDAAGGGGGARALR